MMLYADNQLITGSLNVWLCFSIKNMNIKNSIGNKTQAGLNKMAF